MTNNYIVTAYLIYLPVALILTWFVAYSLFKNGLVFMRDIFFGREEMAKATNSLFKIGFYLLNVGYALYILRIYTTTESLQSMIEALSAKIGGYSIYLGVMLFLNLYLFFRGKKVARQKHAAHVSSTVNTGITGS